jgi:CreA protein
MFHWRHITGAASLATTIYISILVAPSTVDSFVVVPVPSKNGSVHRTFLKKNDYDSLNGPLKKSHLSPELSELNQTNQILHCCLGVAFGVITSIAPLNLPFESSMSTIANAADSKVVGSFSGSGLFFKDTLQVEAFDDPKVQGVKLYVSNFILPINERLSSAKNLLSDPTSASLTCAKTGPIKIADTIVKGSGGEQVFEESKSLLFKSLKVQRVFDEDDKTLIYVSYNTRLDKNDDSNKSRFKSSLCAIGLE